MNNRNKQKLIDKYIDRIKIDYPEDDKLMIDLQGLLNEFESKELDKKDVEIEDIYNWLKEDNRELAQTKFTAGLKRNLAKEIEFRLDSQKKDLSEALNDLEKMKNRVNELEKANINIIEELRGWDTYTEKEIKAITKE